MKISAIQRAIRDGLAPWAESVGGSVEVALDLNHLFALLSIKPGGFRACVIFDRQEKRGDYEEASMTDTYFRVFLSFGKTLKLEKGEAFVSGAEGGQPFADLIEGARETLRALALDDGISTTENTLDYKSFNKATEAHPELLVDSWFLEVSLGMQLPAPN